MKRRRVSAGLICGFAMLTGSPYLAANPTEAAKEVESALHLEADLQNGRRAYLTCAVCHGPEGWGRPSGSYPQIAGQLTSVIIKQLADIRARNRDNPIMFPFSKPNVLGGTQEIADVAAYISNLPMTPQNTLGPGMDLERGQALYRDNCVECHGERGEGNQEEHIPLIQGQHYRYLIRQFEWIRSGKRRNADSEMVKQIRGFTPRDVRVMMDYVSRLRPPREKLAEPGWRNPDYPNFVRHRMRRSPGGPMF